MTNMTTLLESMRVIEGFNPYTDYKNVGQYDGDAPMDDLIKLAIHEYNITAISFEDLKQLVIDDYEDGDLEELTMQDILEILDASGFSAESDNTGDDPMGIEGSRELGGMSDMYGDDPWGIGEGKEDAHVPDDIQMKEAGRDVREVTNKIVEAMREGMMDPMDVALAALKYLSEDQVDDMARANDWFQYEDEDEEFIESSFDSDDGLEDEDYDNEDVGFDADQEEEEDNPNTGWQKAGRGIAARLRKLG